MGSTTKKHTKTIQKKWERLRVTTIAIAKLKPKDNN